MEITKRYIPKHYDTNTPEMVVLHVDLGSYEGTYSHLSGAASASYHYYIRRNGEVVQFVPPKYGAWHAGKVANPTPFVEDLLQGRSPNKVSVGICYEGKPVNIQGKVEHDWSKVTDGQKASDVQINACARLIEHLEMTHLPIVAHKEITSYKPKCVLDFRDKVISILKVKQPQPSKESLLIKLLKLKIQLLQKMLEKLQ